MHAIMSSDNAQPLRRERPKCVCQFCNRRFARKEHLERHLRIHTKEKPFRCSCGASFTRKDLLKRHSKLSHPEENTSTPHSTFIPYLSPGQSVGSSHLEGPPPHTSVDEPQRLHNGADSIVNSVTQPADLQLGNSTRFIDSRMFSDLNSDSSNTPDTLKEQPLPQDSFEHFDDFANFLDLIGFPADWAPLDLEFESPLEGLEPNPEAHLPETHHDDGPFRSWLPSVPSLGHGEYAFNDSESHHIGDAISSARVDEHHRSRLISLVEAHQDILPNFRLPSRHTLTRYITSFFQGFHTHLLFVHLPTFRLHDQSPEFILAMMAAGAQYRFEHQNAAKFFCAAKAIILQKLNHGPNNADFSFKDGVNDIDTIRTLLVLMGYATWECASYLEDAFQLRDLLIARLRLSGLDETDQTDSREPNWSDWISEETVRRTKLAAIFFTHVHSIAYNVYPSIRNNEVKLRLPCPTKLWNAATPNDWAAIMKSNNHKQAFYHNALSQLLCDSGASVINPMPSPLGNYYIIHGLLQRIHIVRELAADLGDSALLPSDEWNRLERALNLWSTMWQQAPESNLDPSNENGPIPFTSSSLLSLAYVRLTLNIGPYRRLESRDPDAIATALIEMPLVWRCARLTPALIYAIHTVSVPVRQGLDYIAKSQAFFWSVRHALSSFECVILLSKWLRAVAADPNKIFNTNEKRIIRWTRLIVEEAYDSMDTDEGDVPGREPAELAVAVLGIWSRFFKQNSQWKFVNILGESLSRYAQLQM